MTDFSFWNAKRVFITGHTGFKGGWLSLWLHALGAQVCGFSLAPPTTPSFFETVGVGDLIESHHGDIRDLDELKNCMRLFAPQVVFHLAAQPLVRESYKDPIGTYSTNVMGTVHVLEACRRLRSLEAVVVITSDKCYSNQGWLWGYRETDPLGGHDPYSCSKSCAELVTDAYRESFFSQDLAGEGPTALASVRAGNVIGGGDWAMDRIVPDAVTAFAAGKPVRLRNPHAVRPWQHVLDPLGGYLLLAAKLVEEGSAFSGAWNFGPDYDSMVSVLTVVEQVAKAWGSCANWTIDQKDALPESSILRLESSKAKDLLKWRPRWSFEEAIVRTVNWHKAFIGEDDIRSYSLKEIEDYVSEFA